MSIIAAIVIGFIVGLIARALMPGNNSAGFIATTLLGIGGALTGKFLGQEMGLYKQDEPAGFLMSLVGALILLFIFHLLTRPKVSP